MNQLDSLLAALRDPRIGAYATSALPVWLWSADGARIVWANPPAAAIFEGDAPTSLATRDVSTHVAGQQIARLSATLPHGGGVRLERLPGLGRPFGALLTCACSRGEFGSHSLIVVAAIEPAGKALPPAERMRRLFAGCGGALAAYSRDGMLLYATPAARASIGTAATLDALGAGPLAASALGSGSAKGAIEGGEISIDRIGLAQDGILLARLPQPAETPPPQVDISAIAQAMARAATEDPRGPSKRFTPLATEDASEPLSPPTERRHPLRFVWQMDADGHFSLGSDEFTEVMGPGVATSLGRRWSEIARDLQLDPEGQIERAVASRETWSALTVAWPVDGSSERLPVEFSGLPIFDRDRQFRGYRGFGVCRDVARLGTLIAARRAFLLQSSPAGGEETGRRPLPATVPQYEDPKPFEPEGRSARNVVPFRVPPHAEPRPPQFTLTEDTAFRELAQQLSERLQSGPAAKPETETQPRTAGAAEAPELPRPNTAERPRAATDSHIVQDNAARLQLARTSAEAARDMRQEQLAALMGHGAPPPGSDPDATAETESAAIPAAAEERRVLDCLPLGVLVYRLNEFLYANRTFLSWAGHETLETFAEAGGLDSLILEDDRASTASDPADKPLLIAAADGTTTPLPGRLHRVFWDGAPAFALIFSTAPHNAEKPSSPAPGALTSAREIESILDTATDGVIVLDRKGGILSVNRSAQALFGYHPSELSGRKFADLFAPESQQAAASQLEKLADEGVAGLINNGREVIGRVREGGLIPLFMTMGRIADGSEKFCAVFRDITQWKKTEEELVSAKLQAEKASSAKSDFLAKISHEIRTPLNAIIGFSEVMMNERFGPIANERYREYLKDINASGAHLVSLLNDLLDLSKIEAGKLDLTLAEVNLNELTQQCVALMQQQANSRRIIIRTSLAPQLPAITADGRSVRQIVLNLLSNSIKFTGAGGQVIVSTALTDEGEIALRVRDTGIGMSENEIKTALEPFRQLGISPRAEMGGTGLGLPLTKALAGANGATFHIRSAVNDGTLVEIRFLASVKAP